MTTGLDRDSQGADTVSDTTASIIIVTWNVRQQVLRCLEALVAGPQDMALEVIVVDNASEDGTAGTVASCYPQVWVIANDENVGYARACNQGIARSSGGYVVLLNPDCFVVGPVVTTLVRYLDAHPTVGMVGPRIKRADGSDDRQSPRRLPTLWSDLCDRTGLAAAFPRQGWCARHLMPEWDRSSSGAVEGLSGACLVLRRQALLEVGLLDEGFFLFGEDADLCRRLGRAGWEIHYVADAVVVHEGGASMKQAGDLLLLYALAGRNRYFARHRGPSYAALHRVLNGLLAAVKVCILLPAGVMVPSYRRKARGQWQALVWCVKGGPTDWPSSQQRMVV